MECIAHGYCRHLRHLATGAVHPLPLVLCSFHDSIEICVHEEACVSSCPTPSSACNSVAPLPSPLRWAMLNRHLLSRTMNALLRLRPSSFSRLWVFPRRPPARPSAFPAQVALRPVQPLGTRNEFGSQDASAVQEPVSRGPVDRRPSSCGT